MSNLTWIWIVIGACSLIEASVIVTLMILRELDGVWLLSALAMTVLFGVLLTAVNSGGRADYKNGHHDL